MFHFQISAVTRIQLVVVLTFGTLSVGQESANGEEVCLGENNACGCFRPGKGLIDLSKIAYWNGSARFEDVQGNDGVFYSYNPCYSFTETDASQTIVSKCKHVAICARNGTQYNGTAVQKNAKFAYDSVKGELYVMYPNPEFPQRFTKVFLRCDTQEELKVLTVGEMYLHSRCACPGQCSESVTLSPGSILLIVFFTVMASYFVIGSLTNRAINGAVGKEVIPNYSFWSELPALIKDGYLFFLSPCLGDQVRYNNIYQNI